MEFINSNVTESIISDGQSILNYTDLIQQIKILHTQLQDQSVDKKDILVFGCENTLLDALLLLTLLENKQHLLLVPKNILFENSWPVFCRYLLYTENNQPYAIKNTNFTESIDFDEPTLMLRTSGSTGTPKLVRHTHHTIKENARLVMQRLNISVQDRIAIPVPLFHMYGLGAAFLPAVLSGASINIQHNANLLRYLEHERQFNPNIAFMTPVFAESLLKGRRSSRDYKFTVLAGDRMREQSFQGYEKKFGPVLQLYGSTEMGAIAITTPDLPAILRQHSVGNVMPDVELHLDKQEELWCKRQYGFSDYRDYTGKAINLSESIDQGWFHTKDRAKLNTPEDYLEILGRSDHCVNRDGLLVSFSEIETAIETLDRIDRVVVIAHGESTRGKKLIAFYNTKPNIELTPDTIRQHCFAILPLRAVPDEIYHLTDFPLLANGKIDRQKLPTLI